MQDALSSAGVKPAGPREISPSQVRVRHKLSDDRQQRRGHSALDALLICPSCNVAWAPCGNGVGLGVLDEDFERGQ